MISAVTELAAIGIDSDRWEAARQIAQNWVHRDGTTAVAFQVIRPLVNSSGSSTQALYASPSEAFGFSDIARTKAVDQDAIFLVASLTKPVVAMGILLLVERGLLALNDRVRDILPGFTEASKRSITVRHLLTHTSGLPDMLPNNRALREANSDLTSFVSETCQVALDFPPGRGVQYQSMGFALLGAIISQVTDQSCGQYLRENLFVPLGMHDTALGIPDDWLDRETSRRDRIAEVRVPSDQQDGTVWNWNSQYWRTFGAPWGGMFSTCADLLKFSAMMLQSGRYQLDDSNKCQLISPATIAAATTNQLEQFKGIPDSDRRTRAWGYGWRLNWTAHSSPLSDLLEQSTYGHWGATGTLWYIDPLRKTALVLLTTEPLTRGNSDHLRLSNSITAALV